MKNKSKAEFDSIQQRRNFWHVHLIDGSTMSLYEEPVLLSCSEASKDQISNFVKTKKTYILLGDVIGITYDRSHRWHYSGTDLVAR